ncbi:MAG: OmpA family protein [Candidatus Sumerlaeia bacterium]|nr:OmpA family protein [Candidatus Sumerlaeia bacterium]
MAKVPEEIVEVPFDPNAWMVTFSDMLNLLLVFFVLLLTMKSMNTKQFKESFGAVETSRPSVVTPGGSLLEPISLIPQRTEDPLAQQLAERIRTEGEAYQELNELLQAVNQNEHLMSLNVDADGLRIRFRPQLLFDPASTTLSPRGLGVLDRLAPLLARIDFPIRLEGHTSRDPQVSPPVQMDLSLRRAQGVLERLMEQGEIPESDPRFTIAGYGSAQPLPMIQDERVAPTDLRQHRVDILIETETAVPFSLSPPGVSEE